MEDFAKEVQTWSEAGEKIIIHMDANSDVRTGLVARTLRPFGFEEQITFRHGPTHPPPAIHMANTKGVPIDGIWTNFSHGNLRCGYLGMEEGLPGDHRLAWIDVPAALLFGHNPPDLHRVYPPSLVVNDPGIRTKYNKEGSKIQTQIQRHAEESCPFEDHGC